LVNPGSVENSVLVNIVMSLNTMKIGVFEKWKSDKLLFAT